MAPTDPVSRPVSLATRHPPRATRYSPLATIYTWATFPTNCVHPPISLVHQLLSPSFPTIGSATAFQRQVLPSSVLRQHFPRSNIVLLFFTPAIVRYCCLLRIVCHWFLSSSVVLLHLLTPDHFLPLSLNAR